MLKIYINNTALLVDPNTTVLETCEKIGIEIPRFCFHSRLSIAGNCRMCLVEIEKSPKPVVSCAMPVMEGMKIYTNTPLVKKARENVLEFLLLNHPLDCPVCDQGGECDLQDQALLFGSDRSRFYDFKRSTLDKNIGPLIKTIMTRCIHCTRCVRFAHEIAGVGDLGTTSRGISTEIGTYIEKVFESELSGNVVDLCPVGALTSQHYAFRYRPWELKIAESIDLSDGIGTNIRIDFNGKEIVRILPRRNDTINEEWISDKTRFCHSGFSSLSRVSSFLNKNDTSNKTSQIKEFWWVFSSTDSFGLPKNYVTWQKLLINWEITLKLLKQLFYISNNSNIIGIFSANSSLEIQNSLKYLLNYLGSSKIGFEKNYNFKNDFSSMYRLNSKLTNIDHSDFCLLVGVNPRYEGSLLNVSLRKRYLKGNFELYSVGSPLNLTYPVNQMGTSIKSIFNILEGKHIVCKKLLKSKKPIIIIGSSLFKRFDMINLLNIFNILSKYVTSNETNSWDRFLTSDLEIINFLQHDSNQAGSFESGITYLDNYTLSKSRLLYSVNTEEFSVLDRLSPFISYFRTFDYYHIIYQGYLNHPISLISNLILPSSSNLEEEGSFLNTETRYQKSPKIFASNEFSRDNWQIVKVISKILNLELKYANLKELNCLILEKIPSIKINNNIEKSGFRFDNISHYSGNKKYSRLVLKNLVEDFYTTSALTRKSLVMWECSLFLRKQSTNFNKK